MQGEAFAALVADIKAHGMREPIVRMNGDDGEWEILDGRNRLRACQAAGIKPDFIAYEGDDPLGYVVSCNLARRHLGQSQRALVAAELANMRQGERMDLQPSANLQKVSQKEAAKMAGVSPRLVASAVKVLKKAEPTVLKLVEAGKVSIDAAEKEIDAERDRKKRAREIAKHQRNTEKMAGDRDDAEMPDEGAVEAADDVDPVEGAEPGETVADATEPPPEADPIPESVEKTAKPKKRCGKAKAKAGSSTADHPPRVADAAAADLLQATNARLANEIAALKKERDFLRAQVDLYQSGGDSIMLGECPISEIADQIRAALGESNAIVLGEWLLGKYGEVAPDQKATE